MSETQELTDLARGTAIIDAIEQIMAEVPGTLIEHQRRMNSTKFLRQQLVRLDELEREAKGEIVPAAAD